MKITILGIKGIPANYGGFETCVDETATRMVKEGHEVTVYCRKNNIKYKDNAYKGVKLVKLSSLSNKSLDTLTHTLFSILHCVFKKQDVIHVYGVGNSIFLPILKLFRKRVMISVDGLDWKRGKWGKFGSWFLRTSEKLAIKYADEVIIDSIEVQKYYKEKYGLDSKYIPYGATTKKEEGVGALEKYNLGKPYILFVGRLIPEKGIHYLIDAYKQLTENTKEAVDLVIVGDDLYKGEYAEKLKANQSHNIKFLGFIYGKEYREICSNALVYVQPSDLEGTSPSLLASMGFGNCVLVSNIPENLETIGNAGLSFNSGDIKDLSNKLETLVNDIEKINYYRKKATERIEKTYNWDNVTKALLGLYKG
ncbi:glycosyl transferase family 1 [Bacillus toyonensis]|uniref:glycosyltransferase n=1 Tax=Bacillus toyonensis TaxID=155322 RepID=UPI000BF1DF3A|nr:glycosyltransferase [Bacillus toyonensis]PEO66116.1 glycosyl transferase family 1 [Bacillus toyonensis]PFX76644.1 glycosyl transferase family 1 [Bacillus toyonensis]PFX88633.1 glycosyl transferase family 1 [Bacillus toyonensis]PGB06554.1 glycosyl transferase family 1 [Bacillus toyonensis]PHB57869.1 glycosyl transferase family 1 [Bacillus toyonensis]